MPCLWNSILVDESLWISLQQQSMYSVTTNQLYRAAAFEDTGYKTPSVIFFLLVRMQGKKLISSSVILEAQLAWNSYQVLCQIMQVQLL